MKKTLLLLSSIAVLSSASAQEAVFKQEAKNKNLELQFSPLGGTPLSIGGLKFRYFTSEKSAIRVNLFVGSSSKTDITQQDSASTTSGVPSLNELKDKKSSLEFSIRPGFEKHFAGTDRLSPYMGVELAFGMKTSSETNESEAAYVIGNTTPTTNTVYTKTTKGKDGYISFGGNLLAGFDWYFSKKVYMGAELGFGVAFKTMSTISVTDENAAAFNQNQIDNANALGVDPPAVYKDPNDRKQGSTMNFGPTVNGQIRLGFLF